MSSIAGIWDLKLKTPIGTIAVVYTFDDTADILIGTASSDAETVPLKDIVCKDTADGQRVVWRQSVTKPMALNLDFDVTTVGDTLSGHAKAGRLIPKSDVVGTRRGK